MNLRLFLCKILAFCLFLCYNDFAECVFCVQAVSSAWNVKLFRPIIRSVTEDISMTQKRSDIICNPATTVPLGADNNYYNLPWEYDADVQGQCKQG